MEARAAVVVVLGVFGVVVGSFLNVVIWRVPRGESIVRPASRCTSCGTAVRPVDNIPIVSWIWLRGRCRGCRSPIGARYPAVELLTGVTFALVTWRVSSGWLLPAFLYLSAIGIALAFIDLDTHRLPNSLTLPSYVVGGLLLAIAVGGDGEPMRLVRAAAGMAILYAVYFALMMARPGGMGFGDVKLAGVLGMFLGFLGWGPLIVGAFVAFLLGGAVGAVLILCGKAGRKAKIPFGPYMVAGALIGILAGAQLVHEYTNVWLS